MVYFLVGVVGIAVVGVFIWDFRRKAAAREAASAERMKAFLEQARANAAAQPAAAPVAAPSTAAAEAPGLVTAAEVTPLQSPAVSGYALRAPILGAEQRVLYLLLKSGLPDHVVFACVSLAAFVQPTDNLEGFAREAQERRLTDAIADFLVCDKSMKPVVAVLCGARSGAAAKNAAFAAACVASIGVRWVEISPQSLPRPNEVRARVLG